MKMSNKMYDVLKYLAQIGLPAIATLYFTLAGVWGLPYAEQVVGTITAIDTFLGVMLGLSKTKYDKAYGQGDGVIKIDTTSSEAADVYRIELNGPVEDLKKKTGVRLKIEPGADLSQK